MHERVFTPRKRSTAVLKETPPLEISGTPSVLSLSPPQAKKILLFFMPNIDNQLIFASEMGHLSELAGQILRLLDWTQHKKNLR